VGVRNGPTLVPLELEAGLIEGATPQFARCLAQGYAKGPIRSLEQDLRAAHREPPSRCTMERMAVAIGTQVKKVAVRLEHRLRAEESVPEEATAINLGLDRTSIPMYEDESREGEVRRVLHYRMGYVGTVTFTDERHSDETEITVHLRHSSTLAGFVVDAAKGTLTPVGSVPTEKQPRGFAIDTSGRYLLAVGQLSHALSSYAIDQTSGKLTKLKEYPMGKNPNWIEIVDLP